MKLAFRSLFIKIFGCFWATVIVTGAALALTFAFQPGNIPSHWHAMLANTASYSGSIVVAEAERGGASAASAYIDRLAQEARLRACLFDVVGDSLAGNECQVFEQMASHVAASGKPDFNMRYGIVRLAMRLQGASGRWYIFATELPAGPRAAFGVNKAAVALQWGMALLVSGIICFLLTRYLTIPILLLRQASQHLATGELGTRAASGMEQRQDELGDLVRDFNAMADRIEELISQQRRLIYDVSHEFRSPLARLNVALDLARDRKGADPAFIHMEQDLERLSEMTGRVLTIARLDTSSAPVEMKPVNLNELMSEIVRDANFESGERNDGVQLTVMAEYWVQGNTELLHSAIENVIRNAIRHAPTNSPIEVHLQSDETTDSSLVHLNIRDHGPGVPESDVINIFHPFYRVADARDRQSGGTGLGLAIADRVIRLHHGTIRAVNVSPHGLQVEITLPITH